MASNRAKTPTQQLFDLPFVGDDIAKIGRIIDLVAMPCQPVGEIWVLAFWQAIPTLFLSLTKLELVDVNIRHRRRRPIRGRRFRFRVADLYRDALVEIPVPRWVVFRVYEWTQRIGWFFIVADALEDFSINWVSTAYRWNGCQALDTPFCNRASVNQTMATNDAIPWRTVPAPVTAVNDIEVSPGHFGLVIPGEYRLNASVDFDPFHIPGQSHLPVATGWFHHQTGEVIAAGEISPKVGPGERASASLAWDQGPGARSDFSFVAQGVQPFPAFCQVSANLEAYKINPSELGPDP